MTDKNATEHAQILNNALDKIESIDFEQLAEAIGQPDNKVFKVDVVVCSSGCAVSQ